MMKLGILTFHRAKNYGAVLQCYALLSFLRAKEYDVSVIEYVPPYLAGVSDSSSLLRKIVTYAKSVLYWIINIGETHIGDVFTTFVNNHIFITDINKVKELSIVICGSDQIWNPYLCHGFDPIYFGLIPHCSKHKTITYAASMGNVELTSFYEKDFLKKLKNYYSISVRESQLSEFLTAKGILNTLVLDPVLLANAECFSDIVVPIRYKKPYILIYELTQMPHTYEFANRISSEIGADIVVVGGGLRKYLYKGIINKQWLSPEQFVSYFAGASFVVTNSFHGLAFSVIYNKPFYCIRTGTWKDERIISLLGQLNLSHRMVKDTDELSFSTIDYKIINRKLQELRTLSEAYLINNISKFYEE